MAEFPEDLAQHAKEQAGIGGVEVQAADEAAQFFFDGGFRCWLDVFAELEGLQQQRGNALEILSCSTFEMLSCVRFGMLSRSGSVSSERYRALR